MSMDLMVKAMKLKVGNALRKLVLLKLADNANDSGECWPSFQHLADQCEISRRSVIAHIDALCASGLLLRESRTGPKGNSSNIYYLKLNGAGDSPGGSADNSLPGAGDSPGGSADNSLPGAADSPGGSAGAAPRISHSFEPVKEPKECQEDEVNDPALRVLTHLNQTTGAKFKDGKTTLGFINGLLSGEYVADELILVIDYLDARWRGEAKMEQYLRPSTMFRLENFEEYLPLARKWEGDGRPALRASTSAIIDTGERDAAYKRFLGQELHSMPKTALEICVRKSASLAGVKEQSPGISKRTWDHIWYEQVTRLQTVASSNLFSPIIDPSKGIPEGFRG